MEEYDLVIIGGGPAGLTAGIYAGRQGMNAVILERMTGAGSGYMVPIMENYPGFDVISGKELLEKMRKQVEWPIESTRTLGRYVRMPVGQKIAGFRWRACRCLKESLLFWMPRKRVTA